MRGGDGGSLGQSPQVDVSSRQIRASPSSTFRNMMRKRDLLVKKIAFELRRKRQTLHILFEAKIILRPLDNLPAKYAKRDPRPSRNRHCSNSIHT